MKPLFLISSILSLIMLVTLSMIGQSLHTSVAPQGILSFELAGSSERVTAILDSWSAKQKDIAALSLGLDYIFIFAYAIALGSASFLLAYQLADYSHTFFLVGVLLAWAQLGTALLDMIENYALMIELLGTKGWPWPMLAKYCALAKFTLLGLTISYLLIAGMFSLRHKSGNTT